MHCYHMNNDIIWLYNYEMFMSHFLFNVIKHSKMMKVFYGTERVQEESRGRRKKQEKRRGNISETII